MNEEITKFTVNGIEYRTRLTPKWINRKKWEKPDPCLLYSHIPGTIMQIDVSEGQDVGEGTTLLILQAMKMNNRITAPFRGKIKKVHVKAGDKIPKGALMIEMEDAETE